MEEHASVHMHVSHPEGISDAREKILADATAAHISALEAAGFEVDYHHIHHHGRE